MFSTVAVCHQNVGLCYLVLGGGVNRLSVVSVGVVYAWCGCAADGGVVLVGVVVVCSCLESMFAAGLLF